MKVFLMACALTQGYTLDCKDAVGGVKEIYLTAKGNITSYTAASGVVTAITMVTTTQFRKYEQDKAWAEFTDAIKPSGENGTVHYEPSVNLIMNKMRATIRNEIKLLAANYIVAIVKDRNGKCWLAGINNGLDMGDGTAATGKAMADRNGYTLTFTGMEEEPAFEVDSAIIAALLLPAT